ncbi:tryptophan-tRNA ligase [Candidatus Saccharibacteria bacterium RAAC3_TM7_1]|nr:tryptophan-tRNA ligase [Candidatus Saccharibacteria bacterium RAAC3_TM7_1]
MTKPVILTGLRANNDLHIGNYFGAMLPLIDMAKTHSDEYQINMFIPDLHSFTTPIDHSQLYEQILNNARLFAAAGLPLDNENIYLYRQSHVSAHSELTWILDCFTGFGEMSRMTQFKDKSLLLERNILKGGVTVDATEIPGEASVSYAKMSASNSVSVGLFNYPVLMAADILLYRAKYVPVGDDQSQHLEFTRDIAERLNNRFGDLFIIPEPVNKQHEFFGKDQGLRIMDLTDPTKKMSKSATNEKGVIFLGDDPEAAAKKIMSATTDDKANVQLDRENQPGVTNLLEILALLRGKSKEETAKEFAGVTRYGDFKKVVADEMTQFLIDFQGKLASVDDEAVMTKLKFFSEQVMNTQANVTLLKVQQAVGLRPKV